MTIRPDTCPSAAAVPPGNALHGTATRRAATFVALAVLFALASTMPPAFHGFVSRAFAGLSNAFAWWSSMMLAASPFVTGGAIAGAALERLPHRYHNCAAFAVVAMPGCDCSGSGYAAAIAPQSPALAGFALAWSAAAGPAALWATHAVLGMHLLVARLAGAGVAAFLTAASWHADAVTRTRRPVERTSSARVHARMRALPSICRNVASALGALAISALVATAALSSFDGALHALASPAISALAGAILSPCSTSDAVIARVLVRDAPAQAAFVIAAQTFDVRQFATIARTFGVRRAVFAAAAGMAGCAAAALVAR